MPVGVYVRTEEHKRHMSEAQKKIAHIARVRSLGKGNPFYGRKHSIETKRKISQSLRGKTGLLSRNWKGGLEQNREYQRWKAKEWRRKNPIKHKRIAQRRLALHKKAGELTLETIQRVYEYNIKYFGTLTCIYCLEPIRFGSDALEHIIPIKKEGTHHYDNLAIACKSCNCSKQDKTIEEWGVKNGQNTV